MAPPAAASSSRRRRDDPAAVARALISKDYDAVCFDCDGVLWKGDSLVTPLVPVLLEQLARRGVAYVFFTNNSLRARSDYAKKFAKLGLDVPAGLIFSSSYAAAAFLRRRKQQEAAAAAAAARDNERPPPPPPPAKEKKKKVYVVGGQGVLDELRLAGFDAFGGPQDGEKRVDFSQEVVVDEGVFAVVVGVDPLLNYYKIHYAALCLLQNPNGCLFLACNEDSRGHFSPNQEWPGAGASVAAVAAVVGRPPDAVVGKPSTFMAREVVEALRERRIGGGSTATNPRVLMVGDRLDTDVAWAHAAADEMAAAEGEGEGEGGGGGGGRRPAMGALLVMSGVATDADLEAWPGRAPEFVLDDVGVLAEALVAAGED